jgi:hypothetical protein
MENPMNPAATAVYRENRRNFSLKELKLHHGNWAAFSPDGRRIVASAPTLVELSEQLRKANSSLQEVVLESIDMEPNLTNIGGAEFL